ncbi:MAG: hypothetical protein A2Y25_07555 [Candidatus Melainabacteria bacterium GWF2_37_15]|nr:MAG: hypothetical protein A2Y25_07555 [Candidatus Melainabacteria bacterium GWF2_37_15]
MNEEFLKTGIKMLTAEKTAFTNILIVSAGATVGLLIKALNGNATFVEIIFVVLGFILSGFMFYLILNLSETTNNFLFELKKKEQKNE